MTQESQCTNTVFVVRPCRFQSNPQTVESNAFQAEKPWQDLEASNRLAQKQFDILVGVLTQAGINCIVFDDTPEPHTPDSVFPNNWLTTHADGTVVLYPMEAENRRWERRPDILEALQQQYGFIIEREVDLSPFETDGNFLEGTGSLVLDRRNRIAYACRSSRTSEPALEAFARDVGYRTVVFGANDEQGLPIYHTNVMMFVGSAVAVICIESVPEAEQADLLKSLESTSHEIVLIDYEQLNAFAGNMLELCDASGRSVIALSQQAYDSLDDAQRRTLRAHASLAICPIDHIETQSGGSVRCMLAEVHLPQAVVGK